MKLVLLLVAMYSALGLVSGEVEAAPPVSIIDDRLTYTLCSLRTDGESITVNGRVIDRENVTIKANIARSYHFGPILVDKRCVGKMVRIVFRMPDENDNGRKFRFLYSDFSGLVDTEHYCECSGELHLRAGVISLEIDSAEVSKKK
jgi:hypothetical protein